MTIISIIIFTFDLKKMELKTNEQYIVRTLVYICLAQIVFLIMLGIFGNDIDVKEVLVLILAGAFGGIVNFFVKYLELPVDISGETVKGFGILTIFNSKPQLTWAMTLIGYIIIGIAGAHLSPLINELIGLKGLNGQKGNYLVLFGYGILFGFFTIKILHRSLAIAMPLPTVLPSEGSQTPPSNSKFPQANSHFFQPSAHNYSEHSSSRIGLELIELNDPLIPGQMVPNVSESSTSASGPFQNVIRRDSAEFNRLVKNRNDLIIFKDEERTESDLMMMPSLAERLNELADLVRKEWPDLKLRVTEAWDENSEHTKGSLHYEARAVDMTVSDKDESKLGRLGTLAVQAKFDWVFYEGNHIHGSTKRDFDVSAV